MPHRVHIVSGKDFVTLAVAIIGAPGTENSRARYRRFKQTFGVPPRLVGIVWKDIARKGFLNHLGPKSLRPLHLLWALLFLRCYDKEETNASRAGCDEKTYRKWVWFYSKCVADLDEKYVSPEH